MDLPLTAAALRSSQSGRTILVVEDEDFLRTAIAGALRGQGYQVIEAGSVAEAQHVLQPGSEVDLVFTDVNLPGRQTGIDLAHWIGGALPHTAVLLTSGQASCAQLRGLAFLRKPYRTAQVVRTIRQLLAA